MAVSILDNWDYRGKKPDFTRNLFQTVDEMVAFSENYLPPVYECNVVENGNRYRYNVSNIEDPILGKWRLVEPSGGAMDLIDYYKKTEVDVAIRLLDFCKIHLDTGAWSHGVLGCLCMDTCKVCYVKKQKHQAF